MATITSRIETYLKACRALGSLNLPGCPFIPKSLMRHPITNRKAYNEFILWMTRFGLNDVQRVWDVGANHGDFSRAASALFPQAHCLMFEPYPKLHDRLTELCASDPERFQLDTSGVGAKAGKMELHVDPANDTRGSLAGFSESYRKNHAQAISSTTHTCDVKTLDDLMTDHAVEALDLLKIDVEGFEAEVLQGGQEALRRTTALVLEVSLLRQEEGADHHLPKILKTLDGHGFSIVELEPSIFDKENTARPVEYNLLALRH